MDRRGSYEGDGGVRLYVLSSSDLPRPIILRSKISKAIQDKSILPRSASQRTPSGTIASAQPSSEATKVVDHLEHSRFLTQRVPKFRKRFFEPAARIIGGTPGPPP